MKPENGTGRKAHRGESASMAAAPFDIERFCRRALGEGHNSLLGLRYVSHDAGHVELLLPGAADLGDLAERMGQGDGPVMALLDMAGTLSVWAACGRLRPHATLDMRIDHLDVAPAGEPLHGRASCYSLNETVASVRGSVRTVAGKEIAGFAAAYMFTDAP